MYYYFVDKKLLNISHPTKGFEKVDEVVDIKDQANEFMVNTIISFKKEVDDKLELKRYQQFIKLEKKFRKETKPKIYEKIKEESDKKKDIQKETNN